MPWSWKSVLELRPDCALVRVGTGQEALQWLQQHTPGLLLLDMHLPDTDGMALLQQIRALPGLAQVPAIGVSADALQETMDRATSQGFQGYWTKPLDLHEVLPDLDAWLARVRTAGSNVAG